MLMSKMFLPLVIPIIQLGHENHKGIKQKLMHLKFWDLTWLKFSSALPNLPNCNSKLKESTTNCDWYQESLHPFGFQPLWSIFYQTPFTNLNLLLKPLFKRKYHTRHITWKLQKLFYTDIWCKQTSKQTIKQYTM